MTQAEALRRVHNLLDTTVLLDGHNDLAHVIKLDEAAQGDLERFGLDRDHPEYDTDVSRLRQGRIGAQVWAAFVPTATPDPDQAVQIQIDLIRRFATRFPDVFTQVRQAGDVERAWRTGRIASILAVEGGVGLLNDPARLQEWHDQDVRLVTLCHTASLDWVDSSTSEPLSGGLSPLGHAMVQELNRLGMVVDCSHVSVSGAHQVLDVSTAPVAFSHSNASTLCDSPRNMPDELLRRVGQAGGIVMATFLHDYVSEAARRWMLPVRPALAGLRGPARQARLADHARVAGPCPKATLAEVADHIEHIAAHAGVASVGIGSDFYGMPGTAPAGLEDVSRYPCLLAELVHRGWSDTDLAALAGRNFLRVMSAAETEGMRLRGMAPSGTDQRVSAGDGHHGRKGQDSSAA